MVLLLMPLIHINFKVETSPVISVSDASERGGGVCVARSLTAAGVEAWQQWMCRLPNLASGMFVLVESCAGIGGARRACELLGMAPALYIFNEVSVEAIRVVQQAWPDAVHMGSMEECTLDKLREVASGVPNAELVLHVGGTPCPGLCGWNPFKHKSEKESKGLASSFGRLTETLREAFPTATVKRCEENVKSMTNADCAWMSKIQGLRPVAIDASGLVEQRRDRY